MRPLTHPRCTRTLHIHTLTLHIHTFTLHTLTIRQRTPQSLHMHTPRPKLGRSGRSGSAPPMRPTRRALPVFPRAASP